MEKISWTRFDNGDRMVELEKDGVRTLMPFTSSVRFFIVGSDERADGGLDLKEEITEHECFSQARAAVMNDIHEDKNKLFEYVETIKSSGAGLAFLDYLKKYHPDLHARVYEEEMKLSAIAKQKEEQQALAKAGLLK